MATNRSSLVNPAFLKRLVRQAVETVDGIRTRVTYVRVTPGSYNPATDNSDAGVTEHQNVPVVLTGLRDNEIDWFPADQAIQRAILAAADLPGVRPSSSDYVVIDGVRWEITRIRYIAGDPVFILFLREP